MTYYKNNLFDYGLQQISILAKVLSHPARLAILRFLARSNTCISVDLSDEIPLSRTTVSQHLQELKRARLILGEIDGTKICYCISKENFERAIALFNSFFDEVSSTNSNMCKT